MRACAFLCSTNNTGQKTKDGVAARLIVYCVDVARRRRRCVVDSPAVVALLFSPAANNTYVCMCVWVVVRYMSFLRRDGHSPRATSSSVSIGLSSTGRAFHNNSNASNQSSLSRSLYSDSPSSPLALFILGAERRFYVCVCVCVRVKKGAGPPRSSPSPTFSDNGGEVCVCRDLVMVFILDAHSTYYTAAI